MKNFLSIYNLEGSYFNVKLILGLSRKCTYWYNGNDFEQRFDFGNERAIFRHNYVGSELQTRIKPPTVNQTIKYLMFLGTAWITIASLVRDTRFTVQGLTEGQEYNFRIHAANENGVGPALQGANPIKVSRNF